VSNEVELEEAGVAMNNIEKGGVVKVKLLRAGKEVDIELMKP
jgi:hypothetical protein